MVAQNPYITTPTSEDKLGSDCSGVDAATNRTLTLATSNIHTDGITVTVNGTTLHEGSGKDFTMSTNVITFLNQVWDIDNIRVIYFSY